MEFKHPHTYAAARQSAQDSTTVPTSTGGEPVEARRRSGPEDGLEVVEAERDNVAGGEEALPAGGCRRRAR
jgi:hypothetical protein